MSAHVAAPAGYPGKRLSIPRLVAVALVAMVAVFNLGGGAVGCAQELSSPAERLQEWAKSFKKANVADMLAFYEHSDHVTAWESSGKARRGFAEVRKMYEEAFDEVVFESVALDSLTVRQSSDVAWATCRFRADTVVRGDGSRWRLDIRGSFVLKRERDSWKIALEHFSAIENVPRVRRRQ